MINGKYIIDDQSVTHLKVAKLQAIEDYSVKNIQVAKSQVATFSVFTTLETLDKFQKSLKHLE